RRQPAERPRWRYGKQRRDPGRGANPGADGSSERERARPVHGVELRLGRSGSRGDAHRRTAVEPAAAARSAARCLTPTISPWRTLMSIETNGARPADPGLETLVTLLHLQGVAADAGQIRHRLGRDKIGVADMLRCAKDLGLKARAYRTDW